MQIVVSTITVQFVFVQMVLLVIHLQDVIQFHCHPNLFHRMKFVIHVIQHHVGHFRIVEILTINHHAHVYQTILARHQIVIQNVLSIQTVQVTKPVYVQNVLIRVQVHVEYQLFAWFLIIDRTVFALMVMLVIHLLAVTRRHHLVIKIYF